MKKIAVFGGSFSPVHKGHMAVAAGILSEGLADEVWMIPCKRNPLKDNSPQISDDLRFELMEKAVEYTVRTDGIQPDRIRISDVELQMPAPSYTYKTLQYLQKTHPDSEFRLAVGADSLEKFSQWKNSKWIRENFQFIVYPRPGTEIERSLSGITYLDNMKRVGVSSTEIRESLQRGEQGEKDKIEENVLEGMPWLKDDEKLKNRLKQTFGKITRAN